MATTYKGYIDQSGLDIYRSTKIKIPKPELYVIYTGDRQSKPNEISLKEEFFENEDDLAIDVKVKMLYGTNENDVISQYVTFTKVYDEQRRLYGRTKKTIEETIRICKNKDILKEYLESREQEVVDMLMTLFDEEQIMKNHDASLTRELMVTNIQSVMEELKVSAERAMEILRIPTAEQSALKKMI